MNSIDSFCYKDPYHFIREARKLLKQHGYVELKEEEEWSDLSNNKYFIVRNERSLVVVNKHDTESALIVATHNDSTCLKLKPNTKLSRFGYDQVRAAPYGNVAYSTWFDRDLTYVGRIITKSIPTKDSSKLEIEDHIVAAEGCVAVIPSLAKHLGGLQISINTELNTVPIDNLKVSASGNQSGQLIRDILSLTQINQDLKKLDKQLLDSQENQTETKAETETKESNKKPPSYARDVLNIEPKDLIVDWDISLIPSEPTRYVGTGADMVSGYAIDVLAGAISSINSFISADDPSKGMNVLAIFDNFQLSSNTRLGAKSTLLRSVLERMGFDNVAWANSRLLVIDNLNAYNPNASYSVDSVNAGDGLFIHSEMARSAVANLNFKSQLLFLAKKMRIPLTPLNTSQIILPSSISQDMETQVNLESAIVGIPIIGLKTSRELAFSDDIACVKKLVSDFFNHYRSISSIQDI